MYKLNLQRYFFSSQIKFGFPQVRPYKQSGEQVGPLEGDLKDHLYVQVYKPDSPNIVKQVHRLKVHKVQQGGTQLTLAEKVGLAVGVKGSPFISGAKVCREARQNGFGSVVLQDSELKDEALGKFICGFLLANYKFKVEGKDKEAKNQLEISQGRHQQIQYLHIQEEHFGDPKLQEYIKLAYYKCYARELSNMRIEGDTSFFLREVQSIYKDNPKVEIKAIVGDELTKEGLNLIHAVGRGSTQPSMLINLTYMGNKHDDVLHGFVGKGIVFDTGGYHLKPYGSMEAMYLDKTGACAVLSAFRGAVEMNLKVNITVTIGLAENAIGNTAYKPSEILHSHRGLTVEINNTDAEGRLVLADCISWTQQHKNPSKMIEVSTLTGACMVALGEHTGGLFTNNDSLAQELIDISNDVCEPLWRLPVTDEHLEMMKGTSADLCNVGKGKVSGASKAAAFLFSFLDAKKNMAFAHLDIAGPMEAKSDKDINSRGATGFTSTLLLKYLIKSQK